MPKILPILFLLLIQPLATFAAPPCDSNLKPESSHLAYRMRDKGTRCEGFYVSDVSARGGLALVGLVLGLAGAWALTRLLQGLLFGTEPLDPATFAGMTLILLIVSLVASWFPARRAAGVDPVESMRME